ncbi:hypothetical protein GLYMA_05G242000v4 [Glycine max]|uniref:UDP-N-acetylglucosamine--N-acetylmuramyl-(Pentapeptide) pyrophosphoryl-undecaprenol N-acetylglucosamine transferase isoform B n=1 Tax=Glycine soja TaxID=3848 RepID=A0A445KTT0_GLYSO|nr:hypothetical protein GLYMA_05G242000v4 [Glycine max]KAH1079778.1 hypothetical protein GYH30_056966 [Glycine max]RZC14091.1 UDP-N-acetylglucosamine--N-acetylmuramyl-(pentapeptide) pyrophosphoryl-undecaprenol N-acetylglucosamine transferase isoform B [Glycine soja]
MLMATTLSFSFPVFQSTPLSRRVSISCHSSNSNNETLRVAFAGGGTGSNVYPAVAIAEELKTANPTCQFLFLCTPDSVESAAISSAGYDFASVSSPPQNLLFFPHRLFKSLIQCLCHLRHFQPDVVVGTGGYVSFPACLAAKLRGTNVVIHEPNSVPGFANSLLSFFADAIFVAFNSTLDSFPRNKCFVCGNPVRLSIRNLVSKVTAMSHFFPGSDSGSRILLVLAGSFGANAVNIAMLNLYYQMLRQDSGLYVIWQTGVEAFDEMDSLVKTHPRLYITPFMHCMGLAYAAADLIVSRAGAMTCYEILATGKPSILIPSPNFSEGNQFRNASLMADLAGVTVITEDELDSSTLAIAIEKILST